ncbi:MAG: ABC transporter permease, partial [Pseudomonadota bacterium]
MNFLANIGRVFLAFLASVGRLAIFALDAIISGIRPPYYPKQIMRQMIDIGYFSLPVIGLTAVFTGAVLALQSYSGFSRFNAE